MAENIFSAATAMAKNATPELGIPTLTVEKMATTTAVQVGKAARQFDNAMSKFNSLFTAGSTMKERNMSLLLFLQQKIEENNIQLLKRIFMEGSIKDLHPSLLKSMLIITEHVVGMEEARDKVIEIFDQKMLAYK